MKRIPHITGHLWSRVCIHPLCFSFGEWGMERWREQDRDKSRHDAIELVQLDELKRWRRRRRRSRTSHKHHSFIIHNTVSKQSQACSWTDDLDFTFTESFFFHCYDVSIVCMSLHTIGETMGFVTLWSELHIQRASWRPLGEFWHL